MIDGDCNRVEDVSRATIIQKDIGRFGGQLNGYPVDGDLRQCGSRPNDLLALIPPHAHLVQAVHMSGSKVSIPL